MPYWVIKNGSLQFFFGLYHLELLIVTHFKNIENDKSLNYWSWHWTNLSSSNC